MIPKKNIPRKILINKTIEDDTLFGEENEDEEPADLFEQENEEEEPADSFGQENEEEELDDFFDDNSSGDFVLKPMLFTPSINEGIYPAKVSKVSTERVCDQNEEVKWVKVKISFSIQNPVTKMETELKFTASSSMRTTGRLFPIIKGILGDVPVGEFDIRQLNGKATNVVVEHVTDSVGNTWANIVATRI